MTVPRLTLYSKPGCHLCDEMKDVIRAVGARTPLVVEVVDISTDPTLLERYALDIPVLLVNGKKAAKHRVTEQELQQKLRRAAREAPPSAHDRQGGP